ncbi:MAG: hypothetical protein JWO57_452 [Pseudonocardiales bacterium]|nr:hypothetical protein [Pseudonocardiales bacterium]
MTNQPTVLSETSRPQEWMLPSWPWTLRAVAIACLLAAEISNTLTLKDRFAEWLGSGILLTAIGAVEGMLAAMLIVRPSARACRAVAVAIVLILTTWLAGLPFGPNVGRSDALRHIDVSGAALLATAAAALLILAGEPGLPIRAAHGRSRGGSLVAGALITLVVAAFALLTYLPGHFSAGQRAPTETPAVHTH